MDLTLFCVLIAVALALVGFGLKYQEQHTELLLIGFLFLFFLSFTLIGGDLEYKTGENKDTAYHYNETGSGAGPGDITLSSTHSNTTYIYTPLDEETSHNYGYWLAILSVLGFAAGLMGIRRSKW